MKTLFALAGAVLILVASAAAGTTNNGTTSTPKDRPVVGMTKDQARAYYGAPFTTMAIPGGERWYYHLKFNEVYGREFVPFYYSSYNVRWGSLDFGAYGRVKSFDWQRVLLR